MKSNRTLLHNQYINFLKLLLKHQVEFFVLGGYAVVFHGHNRFTEDLDIMIASTKDNGKKMAKALSDYGYDMEGFDLGRFREPLHFRIGEPKISWWAKP